MKAFLHFGFGKEPRQTVEVEAKLADWRDVDAAFAMLNWYRASRLVVPAIDETPPRPSMLTRPFPVLTIPTLVIWAMDDEALLPGNLDGLEQWVPDLQLARVPGCGHFVTWEAPAVVNEALEGFLASTAGQPSVAARHDGAGR